MNSYIKELKRLVNLDMIKESLWIDPWLLRTGLECFVQILLFFIKLITIPFIILACPIIALFTKD